MLTIINDDNLTALRQLRDVGERFDLVELDGPYGAGLEGWDNLTDDEYLAHYTERLTLVRDVLQPWGVCYLFGYPEGCAEIKAWARQSGALHLRRWLTWYKQRTAHKGRKVEAILVLMRQQATPNGFAEMLRATREQQGITREQLGKLVDGNSSGRIGKGMYETAHGKWLPPPDKFLALSRALGFNPDPWWGTVEFTFNDLTDLDYISAHYPEDTRELNDAGLRSKPVGLYLDLFRPVVPPRDTKRALVLYGGSGNAAIAAGQLGYEVVCVEQDTARCEAIRRRWAWKVERRDETPVVELGPLFNMEAA